MRYEPMRDYEIDSLKREIVKSLSEGSSSSRSSSDVKHGIESALQDLKRALSSLERNTDSRIRELQQKTSSSSYGYSSYESSIRSDRRDVERAVSKISDQLRNLSGGASYRSSYGSNDSVRKLDRLVDCLKAANAELQLNRRNIDALNKESTSLKKQVGGLGSDMAKMAAGAALATASHQDELRQAKRDSENMVARLKVAYENEIKQLRQELSTKSVENAILAAKISSRNRLDDDNWLPEASELTVAEDYSVLWNEILDDDVIELREVRHIQKWLSARKLLLNEASELAQCCETIIARGEVLDSDAQALYDCSFRLLGALGAKLGN